MRKKVKKILSLLIVTVIFMNCICGCKKEITIEDKKETTIEATKETKAEIKTVNVLDQFNDKVVERTPEEWAKIHVLEEYAPNNEIIGDYDKSLSAKCENGVFVGKMNGDVLTWKGIPYAKQPVGDMRFKKAQAPEPSDKVYEAYHFGKTSMQCFDPTEIASMYEQGEDSLNLNVWSNTTNKDTKKPVLVYIHGGGFALGGTCDPLYNGLSFSTYNPEVLLVTITYRVGMLGLINLSMFPDGDKYSTATNNHIFDQIQALKWIKKNISAFGGDPNNVTISGESAGACSISSLCTIEEAKGLFQKAIPMSGGVGISTKIENTTNLGEALKEEFNVKTVEDLQKIPFEKLKEWWSKNIAFYQAYTINDGKNININPYEDWEKGLTKDVILMHGRTGNEFRYYQYVFGNNEEVYDAFCDSMHGTCLEECKETHKEDDKKYFEVLKNLGYKDKQLMREYANDKMFNATVITQMDYHTRAGGTGFYYIFNMKYDYPDIGSGHAIDCYYLFGSFDGKRAIGTIAQQKISRAFQKMFVNLCVNGDPSIDGLTWTKFNNDTRPTMIFEENDVRIVDNPQKERVDLVVKMSKEEPAYAITGELTYFVPYIIKNSPKLQELAKAVYNSK